MNPEPFGFTEPFRYADEGVMKEAVTVVTVGGEMAKLVNNSTLPNPVPAELLAIAQ